MYIWNFFLLIEHHIYKACFLKEIISLENWLCVSKCHTLDKYIIIILWYFNTCCEGHRWSIFSHNSRQVEQFDWTAKYRTLTHQLLKKDIIHFYFVHQDQGIHFNITWLIPLHPMEDIGQPQFLSTSSCLGFPLCLSPCCIYALQLWDLNISNLLFVSGK